MTNYPKIAITGGSGHLGNCLIQKLLAKGYSVQALYRNSNALINDPQLNWIQGDINNPKAIELLMKGCDVIIHSAGLISIGNRLDQKVYQVNVQGTKTVIKECLKHSSIRCIHISSSNAVQEGEPDEIFDEKRPYKTAKDFAYAHSKALAEQLVLNAVKTKALDAIILRPTSLIGPPDNNSSLLGQTILDLSKGLLPAITTGGYDIVDIRDVSETIIKSISKGIKGEVYLLSGHYFTIKQIALTANPTKTPRVIPLNLLIWILPLIEFYRKVFYLKWPITKESLNTLKYAPTQMSSAKAVKKLDHYSRPPQESIQQLLAWFQHQNLNT